MYVGTAAWAIPRELAASFPGDGSALERYARVLRACEINSTFWRQHRRSTFERWRDAVPRDFRFAVKLPRAITHEARLASPRGALAAFLDEIGALGDRLGPLLVQLPPSLAFDPRRAGAFFRALRAMHDGPVACEPRHASWLAPRADALLAAHDVARVAADPPRPIGSDAPGGARSLVYVRLHGSPVPYRSPYGPERIAPIARRVREEAQAHGRREVWCVFDNTASGAAAGDALTLRAALVT